MAAGTRKAPSGCEAAHPRHLARCSLPRAWIPPGPRPRSSRNCRPWPSSWCRARLRAPVPTRPRAGPLEEDVAIDPLAHLIAAGFQFRADERLQPVLAVLRVIERATDVRLGEFVARVFNVGGDRLLRHMLGLLGEEVPDRLPAEERPRLAELRHDPRVLQRGKDIHVGES